MKPQLNYVQKTENWLDFNQFYPRKSIALDGFVRGGPKFDDLTMHINFNHHEEVDRLATRATCGQVYVALKQGLGDLIYPKGEEWNVWVNDCDEDVCLSWFLLSNPHFTVGSNPALSALVNLEDMMDSTSGTYPIPMSMEILERMAWIFDPYRSARRNNTLSVDVIANVEARIMAHVCGHGQHLSLDTKYEVLSHEQGWVLVKEIGAQARQAMFADGIRAFVAVQDRGDAFRNYTIGRSSQFVPFPVEEILQALNVAEAGVRGASVVDRWGGGNTIGGSPRGIGSQLTPDEVCEVVRNTLSRQNG